MAIRRRAAAVAGHRGDVPTALSLITDPDPGVRATALRALQRAGALEAEQLTEAAADESPVVRIAATGVIAASPPEMGAEHLDGLLSKLLDDPDDDVCESAAWAAGERTALPAPMVGKLAEMATSHDDALVREAAVAALGSLGDPAGRDAILAATHDKATVRRRAVLALASFEGPDVDEALERASGDRDRQVRQAAEDLLAE